MTDREIEQNVSKFKIDLLRKMPFYGDIVANLDIQADLTVPTACTNGLNVRYSPRFFGTLTRGQQNFVIMHEVFHILLYHCKRDKDKNPAMWNVAADIVVNEMLRGVMYDMQSNGIECEKPEQGVFAIANNETVENIYAKIMNDNAKTKKDSNKLLIRDRYASWGGHKLTAINIPSDLWPQPLTEMEEELLKSQIVELVRRASSQTRSPFGHCKIPDAILKIGARSYLNWKKLLRDYMETDRSDETSYATPERKYLHMDLILPGHDMSEEVVEEVWAFVDSSGSIGQEDINSFLTELYHIIKQFQCVMNVCYWDTAVGDVYRGIRSQKELMNCLPHHSGGTNINCVYEWIKANKVKPSVMLILTDGMYGRVTSENYMPSLRRKTILVISNKDYVREDMKELGKIASF